MADTIDPTRADDAPLSTSKHASAAVDAATEALIDKPGQGDADTLVGRTVTINRPRAELFAYWRDFANLATFMDNVERVEILDGKRSHWVVKAPAGKTVEWDATITQEQDGAFIAWASEEGADVPNSGRVDFRDAQAGRGTIVTATILYDPPGGAIGKLIAKMFQREPAIQARRDLRRFKQLMETGEIATSSFTRAQLEEEKN
ncbi:SRPBCC family protein [Sphingomonas sp. MMS12-HWE2-04]|uniref:SRPBCC family protein n=1 Tax=Sphingomonas sp. MMS12-HWE2-04 TaxID=3234199 RepID=UPI00384F5800